MNKENKGYDVDVLVIYDSCDAGQLSRVVESYTEKGLSVSTQRRVPQKLRYKKIVDLRGRQEND